MGFLLLMSYVLACVLMVYYSHCLDDLPLSLALQEELL